MKRRLKDQHKISLLVITELAFVFFAMIGFSLAVVYSMARLQQNIHETYTQPLAVNNAGLDVYTNLSRLRSHTAYIMLGNYQKSGENPDKTTAELEKNLSHSFGVIKTAYRGEAQKIIECEQLLENWNNIRVNMIRLARSGNKNQALKLAASQGAPAYHRLESSMVQMVNSSRHDIDTPVNSANVKSAEIIRLIWWFMGGLIATIIISGALVLRKILRILEQSRLAERNLHESEERMKLALSGADIGTWDLDPVTGKLDFDSQWGGLLNYIFEKDRPRTMQEWASLIHKDDRARVLKAMQDHIEGREPEYKAEYRISSHSGKLKWVAGHGKAVRRDKSGKAVRVVGITRDITLQKQAEDTIWKLAHTDSLTGLPNRSLFYDRLGQCIAQARRKHKKLALLFLDLDDFKLVNDEFGHDTGDALLREAAERLRQNIRSDNTVARTGGDEFIFILSDIANAESAAIVARKIIESIAAPYVIHGNTCTIGCSIGIAIYPDDSADMEKLITQADAAMYKAKAGGKNSYQFFASNV